MAYGIFALLFSFQNMESVSDRAVYLSLVSSRGNSF